MPTTKRSPCFQRSSHHLPLPHLLSCWSRDTALPVCKRTTWVIYKCRFNKINVVTSWRNGFSISPFPIPVSSEYHAPLFTVVFFFFISPLCSLSGEAHCAPRDPLLCMSGVSLCHGCPYITNQKTSTISYHINNQGYSISISISLTTLNNVVLLITPWWWWRITLTR